ncbi:ABC transporter permease [Solirubrobacter sp. CPCC 204708]|uniref:ABC transporter permease n=1 Tax=Solirubrobacter deserti TaxID=2282478 RepID=A0ABT4RMV2_9ACTN|nr:ABC transporter permease [Solirubrobacter deserti]MBE2314975.1 ABC transporter permease [Solirubrobacter deserti]MDA0139890.1 ABC transporter permease [Solirubrobacter deserti]
MINVVNSELFKLRTTRTFLALFGIALAIVLVASICICAFVNFNGEDVSNEILGIVFGPIVRALALVIGILAVTNEFRHGTITPTLLVVPDRVRLMLSKLVAVLALALALGFVSGAIMVGSSAIFGELRDFDGSQYAGALLIGMTVGTALNAALGVGVGVLVRNQVGAIVGILIYGFILEDLIGLIPWVRDWLPKYGLGGVSNALSGVYGDDADFLSQPVAGLLLALYAAIVMAIGLVVMRRRDVTA